MVRNFINDTEKFGIVLREYQKEAIEEFIGNDFKGIFEMATGTGKTLTGLFCSKEYFSMKKRMFLVIIVPYTHLISQWIENIEKIGLFSKNRVLKCYDNKNNWINRLHTKIRDYNIGIMNSECIITTYKTASTKHFCDLLSSISNNAFLLSDECHNFGIKSLDTKKFELFDGRLGLSATPIRWFDENGSNRIMSFFDEIVFSYSLRNAIDSGALVEYEYNPIIIQLTQEEILKYERYSFLIAEAIKNDDEEESVEKLTRKRSLIILKAKEKKEVFLHLMKDEMDIDNALVYCAQKEVDEYTKEISTMGIKVHNFDSRIKSARKRKNILRAFSENKLQVLVAIKCLDEGVDIPSVEKAYFLASTTNPKEFIQRRGRVLRKSDGKKRAIIYDFLVLPENIRKSTFKSIAYREISRFSEFANNSRNKYDARKKVRMILEQYDCEYMLDLSPWDVYHQKDKFEKEVSLYYE
jgi:superfamily II DNA or RNA helicase